MTLNYHLAFDDGLANPSNRLRTFLEERIGTHFDFAMRHTAEAVVECT